MATECKAGETEAYSGTLLIAHPSMRDPNFARSVVLISTHSEEDGSVGVVLNRPLGTTLGVHSSEFAYGPLADVPIFTGGPVQQDQLLLAAWNRDAEHGLFRLFFGISQEKATDIRQKELDVNLCAFHGYSGWSKGQLEAEHQQNAWLVTPAAEYALDGDRRDELWLDILTRLRPELRFLADTPDDPTLN